MKEASGDEPPPPPTPEDPDDVEWFPQAPPPQPPSAADETEEGKQEAPEVSEQEGSASSAQAGEVLGMDITTVLPVQEGDKTAFSEEDEIQYWIEDMGAVTASLQTGFHVVVTVCGCFIFLFFSFYLFIFPSLPPNRTLVASRPMLTKTSISKTLLLRSTVPEDLLMLWLASSLSLGLVCLAMLSQISLLRLLFSFCLLLPLSAISLSEIRWLLPRR